MTNPRLDLRFLAVFDDYMLADIGPPQYGLLAKAPKEMRPARQSNTQIIPP
jgi:hypothetical protein